MLSFAIAVNSLKPAIQRFIENLNEWRLPTDTLRSKDIPAHKVGDRRYRGSRKRVSLTSTGETPRKFTLQTDSQSSGGQQVSDGGAILIWHKRSCLKNLISFQDEVTCRIAPERGASGVRLTATALPHLCERYSEWAGESVSHVC